VRKIGVTMEITKRLYREYVITDEQFEELKECSSLRETIGGDAFNDLVHDVSENGDYESDYAVTDEDGVTILDWDI